ncbi:MAG: RDD family protein [Nitrososphaerales archaeon]
MNFDCPNCGTEFTKGTKFCQTCGCNLELEFIEAPICPQCKKTFAPGTKFCVVDGTRLVRPEDLIPRCTICNRQYSEEIKFCPQDGGEVKVITIRYQRPTYRPQQSFYALSNRKYPKASLGNRFLAALLDGLISAGLSIPAILFFVAGMEKSKSYKNDGAGGLIFIAVLFYLLPLIYSLIKDGLGQGQSWGKKPLDLMVINLENNSPCDKGKSFVRNIISALLAIIPFIGWLIEPIMVIATDDGRKLGDKAANTQVIEIKNFN